MRPIFDAHLDLAYNALNYNRDLLKPVYQLRLYESTFMDAPGRGRNTVTLPELKKARVAVCLATLMARSDPEPVNYRAFRRTNFYYATRHIAYAYAYGSLGYYRLMADLGYLRIIRSRRELAAHWADWLADPEHAPIGVIVAMEGADPIVEPEQAEHWFRLGLRVVSLVHYGLGYYAHGTGIDGPVTLPGLQLLERMRQLGLILDVTHLSDQSFWHALQEFSGPVLASHHNLRHFVSGDRQLSDEQVKELIRRDAVIGLAFDASMLYDDWEPDQILPRAVSIEAVADHIDRICQFAGNVRHVGWGTDLDGGYGTEQTPGDLDTICDLHKLEDILARRGYSSADIDAIFYGNWLRFFSEALPDTPASDPVGP